MPKRIATRTLSDAYTKARSPGAKPARVSFIRNGIKYKSGQAPVRVSPAAGVTGSAPLASPVALVKSPIVSAPVAEPVVVPAAPAPK
jgi:hypothetical protein